MDDKLKYPIGQFKAPQEYSTTQIKNYIQQIRELPAQVNHAVSHLTAEQLDTAYRMGGWTVRQVVHHLADSHMNAIIRFKLALTEESPVIKPYIQDYWVTLADSKMAIAPALNILEGVHERLAVLLESLNSEQWWKVYIHPEKGREVTLQESAASYAWHGMHHLAHITSLKTRNGWT
jgi:hypothetical protein